MNSQRRSNHGDSSVTLRHRAGSSRAVPERTIMAERQAGGQHGADPAAGAPGVGPHHLELASDQAALPELVREQQIQLVACARSTVARPACIFESQ